MHIYFGLMFHENDFIARIYVTLDNVYNYDKIELAI